MANALMEQHHEMKVLFTDDYMEYLLEQNTIRTYAST